MKTEPNQMDYDQFLRNKVKLSNDDGFPCEDHEFNQILKPHQRAAAQWLVTGGRRGLFASFGLGKSAIQLEAVRMVTEREKSRGLIVMPLGVRQEFTRDAVELLGWPEPPKFIRRIEEAGPTGIYLTNYETIRDEKMDPAEFIAVSLDEAAVLRGFGGSATFRSLMRLCTGDGGPCGNHRQDGKSVKYRFVATATPSPNEYIELLAYADFLGIMDISQAKTRYFKRDSTKADKLTIHAHKEREFWMWVASWALFITKPSDLGYPDDGYTQPPMQVRWHCVSTDHTNAGFDKSGQAKMFRDSAIGVQDASSEKRNSMARRIEKMVELRTERPKNHVIIWHDLEDERHAIKEALPDAVSVYGSQKLEDREASIIGFSNGEFPILSTKPSVAGSGCNFQRHCAWAIYLGIGFKFHDFIQALHRILRFLQEKEVCIDIIYTEAEQSVKKALETKWGQHNRMVAKMTEIIKEFGLSKHAMAQFLTRKMGVDRVEVTGERYRLVNEDCVKETARMKDGEVDLILTSIPFSSQYEYSPNYCYDEQTEVLTRRGWLSFGQLNSSDMLATMNQETRRLEWQAPLHLVWEPYSGKMLHFKNGKNDKSFDLLVTPNHGMIVDNRIGNHKGNARTTKMFRRIEAREIARNFVVRKWRMVNVPEPGGGEHPASVEIPPVPPPARGPKSKQLVKINIRDFMQLSGWYLSEGYCDSLTSTHAGRISLCQCAVNPDFRLEIAALIQRIGLTPRPELRAIVAHNVGLAKFLLEQFGSGSHVKSIPRWIKDLHPELLCILRDTMMKGDGNKDGYAYCSFSQSLRDDFQEICLLTGWRAAISGNKVNLGQKRIYAEIRKAPDEVEYQGMIGCATVQNGTLIVRRNGTAIVSGNSDFGHSEGNDEFFEQMDYLTPNLLRVLKPGRLACIHVKDRIVPGGMTGLGFQTVYPFHVECIKHYTGHGFAYMGMKTIVTDVVRENNQTYRLGWTEQCKDGTKMGVGMPEYLLIFRRPPTDTSNSYADVPVVKSKEKYTRSRWQIDAHGFARSSGNRLLTPEELINLPHSDIFKMFRDFSMTKVYDFEHHVKIGEALDAKGMLPVTFMLLQPQSWHDDVWTDITRMRTLNAEQWSHGLEMHLCPMQYDIADRVIEQMSMPGEVVYDPFGGLGTVPMRAVLKGRRGVACELSPAYFTDAAAYCKAAEVDVLTPTLFDLDAKEEEVSPV